jgi:spore maturation protein CgeB
MARCGYCPSGRFFEAAACGAPILTDPFCGLSEFFAPGHELQVVETTEDVLAALRLPDEALRAMARRARERTLDEHTGYRRALTMLKAFEEARSVRTLQAGREAA